MKHGKHYGTRSTPQTQPVPGKDQVRNTAGGYSFEVDDWTMLDRFLMLGTEGGTYYISERDLTIENAEATRRCIDQDGLRVVDRIVEISTSRRAPRNDPAIFALAMCLSFGNTKARRAASDAVSKVCRIGTHLFLFNDALKSLRGRGRLVNRAIREWYQNKPSEKLAYQLIKYQQREGWSHRDLLRLARPKPKTKVHDALYAYAVKGKYDSRLPSIIGAFERAKEADEEETIELIRDHGLTREMVMTKHLNSPDVWAALAEKMPMHALIRNLGNMSKVGYLAPGNFEVENEIAGRIADPEAIRGAGVHPLAILNALAIYAQGHGWRGSGSWQVSDRVTDALDEAFYHAFENVEPTGKRILVAIDASGSMRSNVLDGPLTVREAALAMGLVVRATEPNSIVTYFTQAHNYGALGISNKSRLDQAMRHLESHTEGTGTDASLPFLFAIKNDLDIDAFVIFTDSETWAGAKHPFQALNDYRNAKGRRAKAVVVAMAANRYSIGDDSDPDTFQVAGFDTSLPAILRSFITE